MDLNIVWFILLIVLFSGFVILDGFDLGVGMVYLESKGDENRRILMNSIGPFWDGNEVWLLTAGGALFAAFPHAYATVFSGFYLALMLLLLVLILRAVSMEFRSKVEGSSWRGIWDIVFSISSFLITFLLGVALGNIITGIPIGDDLEFTGNFWTLIKPYTIFVGLTAIVLLRVHGRLYLALKTEGELQQKIMKNFKLCWIAFTLFFIILTIWTTIAYPYTVHNFSAVVYAIPVLTFVILLLIPLWLKKQKYFTAFLSSSLVILLSITIVGISIFPNLVKDSDLPGENTLTIYNAASSNTTLETMLIIALIAVPIVLAYTVFIHRVFKGKTKIESTSY